MKKKKSYLIDTKPKHNALLPSVLLELNTHKTISTNNQIQHTNNQNKQTTKINK